MTYPIFNSFVNQIENQLSTKNLSIKTFKTWCEDRINATGLEIVIDTYTQHNFIKEVSINFDWDRFREINLAQQLEGLGEHPMLQENNLKSVTVTPKIDIEMSWIFDEKKSQIILPSARHIREIEKAGKWMEKISRDVNRLLTKDDVITRWHIEIEGTYEQKYLSAARLLSYFQYSLTELKSLNETHDFVKTRMQDLMVKSQKVRSIATDALKNVA